MFSWGWYKPKKAEGKETEECNCTVTSENAAVHSIAEGQVAKNVAQNRILDAAVEKAQDIRRVHAEASLSAQRGHMFEVHAEATFNVDAVKQGATYRAELAPPNNPGEDIFVVNSKTGAIADTVQLKSTSDPTKLSQAARNPKYDGMQKVGLADVAPKASGASDRVAVDKVTSAPLTSEQADSLAQDPAKHFDQFRPNTTVESLRAGCTGAAVGAGLGAFLTTVQLVVQKGTKWDRDDFKTVGESAAVGASTGGVGAAAAVAAGSAFVGGLAGGTVATAYCVWKCPSREGKLREGLKGSAAVAAGLGVNLIAGVVFPPLGVAGLLVSSVAAVSASMGARSFVSYAVDPASEVPKQVAAAGGGAEVVKGIVGHGHDGKDLQPSGGEDEDGEGLKPSSGEGESGEGVQPSSGEDEGGEGLQPSSGEDEGGEGLQLSSGEDEGGEGVQPSSGEDEGGEGLQPSSGEGVCGLSCAGAAAGRLPGDSSTSKPL